MKFYKKITSLFFTIIVLSSFVGYSNATNHYVSGYDSVDGDEIRYTVDFNHSTYYSKFNYSKNKWNNYGDINIAADTWYTVNDLEVYEVNAPWFNWPGRYSYNGEWQADYLQINHAVTNDYTSNKIKNVMIHELGHSLGLDHSYYGNQMNSYTTGQTWLGYQDKSDYDYLWD